MPIQFSPDDFQNNDFQLAQNNAGDLVLEHKQTGGRFKFDATTDSWVPVQGLDLQGADIVNVGASKTNFTEKADLTSSNGVLQSSQLPDLAITNIDVVANQSERLSLTAEAFLSSSSSTDPIPLDRITYDPDGNFDTTTHKYTVPATGTYQVSATIRLENSIASGTRADFFIALNGSAFSTTELVYQSGFPSTSITDVREFTSGDQITLGNSSGRSVTDSENNTFLVVLRLE